MVGLLNTQVLNTQPTCV